MGRLDEARKIIAQLRAITPVVVPRTPLGNAEHRELILSDLRPGGGRGHLPPRGVYSAAETALCSRLSGIAGLGIA